MHAPYKNQMNKLAKPNLSRLLNDDFLEQEILDCVGARRNPNASNYMLYQKRHTRGKGS